MSLRPCIAVTSGEPAGIGPELCAALSGRRAVARLVVLGEWLTELLLEKGFEIGHVHIARAQARHGCGESAAKPIQHLNEFFAEPLSRWYC